MIIPFHFYLTYWLNNSAFALATNLLILFLIPPLLAAAPWVGFIGFLAYQFVVYRQFWGDRRGDLEYTYREKLIDATIRNAIIKTYGFSVYLKYRLDNLNQISSFTEDFFLILLPERPTHMDDSLTFSLYIKLAEYSLKDGAYQIEKFYLEKALEKRPGNLVAHFRLAVVYERLGDGQRAIEHYKSTSGDSYGITDQLKRFITLQISRVAADGPRKEPPIPGLRFLTW